MIHPAHIAVAEQFVASDFPRAAVAIVAGSTARGERTATSDIDLLLIGENLFADPARASIATTQGFGGEIFEVFGYTSASFDEWAQRDIARYRPVIVNMLLDGVAIRDDGSLADLRARWSPVRDAGPEVDRHDIDVRRYIITDLLDDLRDATDRAEQLVVAAALFEHTAHFVLLTNRRWIAVGKHLPRALRAWDPGRARRLIAPWAAADHAAFADAVEAELIRAGGRLQDGFTR